MREFFRGWRRKVGCIVLLMSLGVTGLWIRSRNVTDTATFPLGSRQHVVVATEGLFFWYAFDDDDAQLQFASIPDPPEHLFVEALTLLEEDLSGAKEMHYWLWMIPLWTIACPLTVLSAGLLLWPKPKRHQEVAAVESSESLTPPA